MLKHTSWQVHLAQLEDGKFPRTLQKFRFSKEDTMSVWPSLRKKCPNTEFFLVHIFPHSDTFQAVNVTVFVPTHDMLFFTTCISGSRTISSDIMGSLFKSEFSCKLVNFRLELCQGLRFRKIVKQIKLEGIWGELESRKRLPRQ